MYSLSEPSFKGNYPYETTVTVDGKPLVMELDTGAAVSVIGETPSGVSSAPGIFQRTMDSMLQGFPGVVCYLDDILVTGKTTQEHRDNLERVLKRLEEAGVGCSPYYIWRRELNMLHIFSLVCVFDSP